MALLESGGVAAPAPWLVCLCSHWNAYVTV